MKINLKNVMSFAFFYSHMLLSLLKQAFDVILQWFNLRDRPFYKSRHDRYTQAASWHDENFDQFSLSLEILRHHQCAAVSCHSNSYPCIDKNKIDSSNICGHP